MLSCLNERSSSLCTAVYLALTGYSTPYSLLSTFCSNYSTLSTPNVLVPPSLILRLIMLNVYKETSGKLSDSLFPSPPLLRIHTHACSYTQTTHTNTYFHSYPCSHFFPCSYLYHHPHRHPHPHSLALFHSRCHPHVHTCHCHCT